jgi:hypothetical protein
VLEPEAALGAGVLGRLLDHLFVLFGCLLPILGLLVGGELLVLDRLLALNLLAGVGLGAVAVGSRPRGRRLGFRRLHLFRRRSRLAVAAVVVGRGLLLGHQLGQRAREGVDLVRREFCPVTQLRRFDREQALKPEQQREGAAPLLRGILEASVDLLQRRVEGAATRGSGGERLRPLAVEQEGLAGKLRRTLDIGA